MPRTLAYLALSLVVSTLLAGCIMPSVDAGSALSGDTGAAPSVCTAWGQPSASGSPFEIAGNVRLVVPDSEQGIAVEGVRVTIVSDNEVQSVCSNSDGKWQARVSVRGDVVAFLDPVDLEALEGITTEGLQPDEWVQRSSSSDRGSKRVMNFFLDTDTRG